MDIISKIFDTIDKAPEKLCEVIDKGMDKIDKIIDSIDPPPDKKK